MEKLPVPKIVEYFANHFKIAESELPHPRDFSRQFKKWGFPDRIRRLNPDEELTLKERMRELFKLNITAQEIQDKLNGEGWELDDYRFKTFRKRLGLLYRTEGDVYGSRPNPKKRKRNENIEAADDSQNAVIQPQTYGVEATQAQSVLSAEEESRRAQRLVELQIESDHRLQTNKRRHRIRGIGHIGPDPAGLGPRYSSETSLDECKAYLHLSNDLYTAVRAQYENICRDMGVVKMSLCAEGQWQESKDRLIRENMHLSSVLHPLQPDIDKRLNALNCICSDVTKRMRQFEKSMTIADASNILSLDPLQSKEIRRMLYEILEADHFTTVFESGKEHYEQLQQQWHAQSPLLTQVMAEGDATKVRAVSVLCKDARKRYCDDQVKKNPQARTVQASKGYGPGPGPAPYTGHKKRPPKPNDSTAQASAPTDPLPLSQIINNTPSRGQHQRGTLIPLGPAWEGHDIPRYRMSTLYDLAPEINFDLDPLLTRTTHGSPWPPPLPDNPSASTVPDPTTRPAAAGLAAPPLGLGSALAPRPGPRASESISAYFRLALSSTLIGHHPRMWLGKLSAPTMAELRKAATSKAGAARMGKIHGVVKNADGSEDSWLIESEDELEVYLGEAEKGEKRTFVVVLEGGYA